MNFYLDLLTDDELQYIVRDDLAFFLEPIKQNEKNYIRYHSQLGTKKKDSLLVKTNLPRIAASLYRKKDKNYVKAMEIKADAFASMLMQLSSDTLDRELSPNDMQQFTDEQLVDLLKKFQSEEGSKLDIDLLGIQLKLVGINDVEVKIEKIKTELGIVDEVNISNGEDERDLEQDTEAEEDEPQAIIIKKPKVKKLTAEEKAAKNKAAIDAKERAKIEEKNQREDNDEPAEEEQNAEIDSEHYSIATTVIDTVNEILSKTKTDEEAEKVAKYIGVISIKTNYYNFTPIGVYEAGSYYAYSERELDDLLPKSNKHNINFYYNFWDEVQTRFMKEKFQDGQPVVLCCEIDSLE